MLWPPEWGIRANLLDGLSAYIAAQAQHVQYWTSEETAAALVCVAIVAGRRTPFRPRGTAASGLVWSKRFHRAGLFAFRTLPVFDARALLIAFSAALILASRLTSGVGKFKAKFSLASARFKRSAFLVSEIGWPMLLPYRKTTPSRPLGS